MSGKYPNQITIGAAWDRGGYFSIALDAELTGKVRCVLLPNKQPIENNRPTHRIMADIDQEQGTVSRNPKPEVGQ